MPDKVSPHTGKIVPCFLDILFADGNRHILILYDRISSRYFIKQHGAMLAKGRLLGIQYEVLFTDHLYEKIALHADELAMRIRHAFEKHNVSMLYDSVTNQQYPVLTDTELAAFSKKYAFSFWCKTDDTHSAVRVCTSWATKEEVVDELIRDIDQICNR